MQYYQDRTHLVQELGVTFDGGYGEIYKNRIDRQGGAIVFEKYQIGEKWVVLALQGKDGFCRKLNSESDADDFIAALQQKVTPIIY